MDSNKKFWNRFAKLYTPLQEKSNKKIYGYVIERCKKYINKGTDVLELASGTGQFTFSLCNNAKSFTATDFSENMVSEGNKRASVLLSEEERKTVTFCVEDATKLSYKEDSFDVVLIANALHIMPNPNEALKEIMRVLKKDGVLIAPTFVYEGKINHFRMWVISKAGFKTFHKWKKVDLENYLKERGYSVIESEVVNGKPLPELFIVCKKSE